MKRARKAGWGVCLLITLLLISCCLVQAAGMNVQTHTPEEIRKYIKKSGATVSDTVTYKKTPNAKSPYKTGALSDSTLQSALKIVQQVRYIAGLNTNLSLDTGYTESAQAAALVNAANGMLSHYPEKPSGMKKNLYQLGYNASSHANLAKGFSPLGRAIVHGWMYDGDDANIDRLGHRRWILNPSLKKTGFGWVGDVGAMYVHDYSGSNAYTNVAWPAQNMPLEYFGSEYPWSISTGTAENINTVKVTMIRQRDQKKWSFSRKSSGGYFNVNNGAYGQPGCIIFRPKSISYQNGDRFDITITGTKAGTISYTVNFFSLNDTYSPQPDPATDTNTTNKFQFIAKKKGFTVKWTQQSSQVSGCEIAYSTSKNFPKKKTGTVTLKKKKNASKTVSGLKANKKYYVRVRLYKSAKVNGKAKKTYTSWSNAVPITTLK